MVRNEGHAYTEVISSVPWYTGTLGVGCCLLYDGDAFRISNFWMSV